MACTFFNCLFLGTVYLRVCRCWQTATQSTYWYCNGHRYHSGPILRWELFKKIGGPFSSPSTGCLFYINADQIPILVASLLGNKRNSSAVYFKRLSELMDLSEFFILLYPPCVPAHSVQKWASHCSQDNMNIDTGWRLIYSHCNIVPLTPKILSVWCYFFVQYKV